ncbi:hypothetical protein CDAR_195411 [Caerostris darwini]|uniref:Uncharacterized protein n=1 Tax=Caerostris darwini TaxID=1538125 RepID=A0AAV4RC59_9ARAC|nr:hypothetical protein CDAR_195411 [Caerostris darwini]
MTEPNIFYPQTPSIHHTSWVAFNRSPCRTGLLCSRWMVRFQWQVLLIRRLTGSGDARINGLRLLALPLFGDHCLNPRNTAIRFSADKSNFTIQNFSPA